MTVNDGYGILGAAPPGLMEDLQSFPALTRWAK
jgi:hypothetical protein